LVAMDIPAWLGESDAVCPGEGASRLGKMTDRECIPHESSSALDGPPSVLVMLSVDGS